ncbi:MAG TPA: single-stranded DNA-binding protein [Patescibacteria group bacterium]|nr:single-stranded DNA-binding protein [Patescibacteria group bacterium]
MARSLNRVQLIGNLTRDPELRYTPSGTAVCSFSLATNRSWTTDTGEKHEEADFHRIVAWNKLAELCSQFLVKGRKVYVEGRLSTRNWTTQDNQPRTTTEVVIDDMILLDSKGFSGNKAENAEEKTEEPKKTKPVAKHEEPAPEEPSSDQSAEGEPQVAPDDIPF